MWIRKTIMQNCRFHIFLNIILKLQSIPLRNWAGANLGYWLYSCMQFCCILHPAGSVRYMKNGKHSHNAKLCIAYPKLSCEYKTCIVSLVGAGITGPWERITVCHILRHISLAWHTFPAEEACGIKSDKLASWIRQNMLHLFFYNSRQWTVVTILMRLF